MTVENAKMADIALLTELRLAYLEEDNGKLGICKRDNEKTSVRCKG